MKIATQLLFLKAKYLFSFSQQVKQYIIIRQQNESIKLSIKNLNFDNRTDTIKETKE